MATTTLTPAELHHDRAPELAASVGTFLLISTVCVLLRVYVRTFISKAFGWDDGMIVFTLVGYIIYASFVFAGISYGTGQHMAALTIANFQHAMKMWYFCEIFYAISASLVRISIGMLLLRLTTIHWHRVVVWIAMAFSTTAGVILTFTIIYQCQPIDFFWTQFTRPVTDGHCIDPNVITDMIYMHGAVGCLCDWTLGILPWIMVRGLNMNRRMKITVGILLCLANFGSIAAVVRFYCIKQIATSSDFLYSTVDIAIWSSLEAGTAIPAASIITLRPLFRRFFGTDKANDSPTSPSGPGFRGAGYVRHNTPSSMQMKNMLRPNNDKSLVTTTITGTGGMFDHDDDTTTTSRRDGSSGWRGGKKENDSGSDELPLQIMTERDIDVEYSRPGSGRAL